MSSELAIKVTNVSKCYQIYDQPRDRLKQFVMPRLQRLIGRASSQYFREFWALNDVSFEVKKGETVGIIGRNGAGKSTLLQILCGTLSQSSGGLEVNGRVAALLELGSGFNAEFTGRENVYMNAGILGLTEKEIDERFDDIVAFADIGQFLDQPVKTYSSGMYVRLAFAVVVHVDADILIVDEALSVGDAFFQAKCMSRLNRIVSNGTTVLFVSHDINAVKAMCKRTLWLDHGEVRAFGETSEVAQSYGEDWIRQANSQHLKTSEAHTENIVFSPEISFENNLNIPQELRFSSRSGTGQARYLDFQCFCGDDPIGQLSLEFGSLLRMSCLIETTEICERLIVAIHIKDRNGQHLVGVNTGLVAGIYGRVWQRGERFKVNFKLPISLQAGRYAITALISSLEDVKSYADVKFFDWLEDVDVFEVSPRSPLPLSDLVEIKYEVDYSVCK